MLKWSWHKSCVAGLKKPTKTEVMSPPQSMNSGSSE